MDMKLPELRKWRARFITLPFLFSGNINMLQLFMQGGWGKIMRHKPMMIILSTAALLFAVIKKIAGRRFNFRKQKKPSLLLYQFILTYPGFNIPLSPYP